MKFTPPDGKIKVRLAKENDQVLITVEDTGQGSNSIFLPHVFELFRQADASTSRAQSGMGIGLAVVHQLVDLHKGSIDASRPDGTRRQVHHQTPIDHCTESFARAGRRSSHFIG